MIIILTKGQITTISDRNPRAKAASKLCWYAQQRKNGFHAARKDSNGRMVYLHRFLMDAPPGVEVDHRDGNGLNNYDGNLRFATHAEQQRGFRTKTRGCSSKFRGVCWHSQAGGWVAYIDVAKKRKHLGLFQSEVDAARAHIRAARKYFGKFGNRVIAKSPKSSHCNVSDLNR